MFTTQHTHKELRGKSGIYKITLKGTNRNYVGQARNLLKRMRSHINEANSNSRIDRRTIIQHALLKYGPSAFEFSVLVFCEIGQLNELENHFIGKFHSEEGFNLQTVVGREYDGVKNSKETAEKIRIANTGKKRSPETIERMRQSALNKPKISEETRVKLSASHKGFKQSEAQKEKVRQRMLGTKHTEESKAKIRLKSLLRARPVQQLDPKSRSVIATHPSVSEAARSTGSQISNLTSALRGRLKTHNGFAWQYLPASTN